MKTVKEINIADFDYDLPDEMIPPHPSEKRDECRLLLYSPERRIYHKRFKELGGLLPVGSLLVWNDTKVINARLHFRKETGAEIEIFLLEPGDPSDYEVNFQRKDRCVWKCLVGNLKKWKNGTLSMKIDFEQDPVIFNAAKYGEMTDGSIEIEFSWDNPQITFSQIIEKEGTIPIPPYLNRESEERDNKDYQTVFARWSGSVAAPTAGLHFTPFVIEDVRAHGIEIEKVTLHVGAGTFKPVKEETIGSHVMHSEPFEISRSLVKKLWEWKKQGKPVIATGTTTVRTLESLPYLAKLISRGVKDGFHITQWEAYDSENCPNGTDSLEIIRDYLNDNGLESITASTSIIIAPGFEWKITDGMITNFHQPKSTLLLLVSSFLDRNPESDRSGRAWLKIYESAKTEGYRFLSYGDAMLLLGK